MINDETKVIWKYYIMVEYLLICTQLRVPGVLIVDPCNRCAVRYSHENFRAGWTWANHYNTQCTRCTLPIMSSYWLISQVFACQIKEHDDPSPWRFSNTLRLLSRTGEMDLKYYVLLIDCNISFCRKCVDGR